MDLPILIGDTIRHLRKTSEKSLREVERETGISYRHLIRIEKGQVMPTASWIFLIAASLDVTPDTLLSPAWAKWIEEGQPDFN